MMDLANSKRLRGLCLLAVIWLVVLTVVEVRFLPRPKLALGLVAASPEAPVPDFNLRNSTFPCANSDGFVTAVQTDGHGSAAAKCETPLTEATTRCPSNFPLYGFADVIKCSEGEAIHCTDGPLQTLGLFKDDSFCGDITDRDLGPPQESVRAED